MEFYPEMFWSKWHVSITLGLTAFACLALIIGKYSKQQIVKTTLQSAIIFYGVTTVFFIFINYDQIVMKHDMYEKLEEVYEENQNGFNDHLVTAVQGFIDGNDKRTVVVYVGNFDEQETFEGVLHVWLYQDDVLADEKMYEDLIIEPGEKFEIDRYELDDESITYYEYLFR